MKVQKFEVWWRSAKIRRAGLVKRDQLVDKTSSTVVGLAAPRGVGLSKTNVSSSNAYPNFLSFKNSAAIAQSLMNLPMEKGVALVAALDFVGELWTFPSN